MKTAWAASILAQALLALTLYRAGQRDWWTLYLMVSLVRQALLWPLWGTDAYFYAWFGSEVLDMAIKLAVAWQIAHRATNPSWAFTGVLAGVLLAGIGSVWSPEAWPLAKRARLLFFQCGAFTSAGVVFGAYVGHAPQDMGVSLYFLADTARAIAEMFTRDRESMDALNVVYLWFVALSFCAASIPHLFTSHSGYKPWIMK